MSDYPSWRFHPELPNCLVKNEVEDRDLGDPWRDSPYPEIEKEVVQESAVITVDSRADLDKYKAELDAFEAELVAELDKLQADRAKFDERSAKLTVEETDFAERKAKFDEIEKKNYEKFVAEMAGKTEGKNRK